MDVVFKKYFWVVNLLAIVIIAWFMAAGINDYIAAKLFAVPSARASADSGADAQGLLTKGRIPADQAAASVLGSRRIFDLNADEEPAAEEEDPKDEEEEKPQPEGELEESELPIDLMGTMVSDMATTAMATLNVEGENKLAWVGSEFLEGKAKIVTIAPRHVVVDENGRFKVVKLWSDKKAGAAAKGRKLPGRPSPGVRPGAATKTPSRPVARRRSTKNNWSEGIKKTGAYDYEIDKSMLDEQLADLSSLGREARIVPNYKGGKYEGFKLVGVRPGSLYRSIGIRSGDVIKSINGKAIDSPNKAIELFDKLKNSNAIQLDIERRGQAKSLNYSIR